MDIPCALKNAPWKYQSYVQIWIAYIPYVLRGIIKGQGIDDNQQNQQLSGFRKEVSILKILGTDNLWSSTSWFKNLMHFWSIFWLSIVNHQSMSCVFDTICICLLSYWIHLHHFTSGKLTQTILGHRANLTIREAEPPTMSKASTRPSTALKSSSWERRMAVATVKTASCHDGDGTFYFPCKERGKLGNTKPYLQIRKSKAAIHLSDSQHPTAKTHRSHVPRTSWASCNTVVQFHPCRWKQRESTMDVMDGFTFGMHRHPLGSFGTKVARFDRHNFSTDFLKDLLIEFIQEWFQKRQWLVLTSTWSRRPCNTIIIIHTYDVPYTLQVEHG